MNEFYDQAKMNYFCVLENLLPPTQNKCAHILISFCYNKNVIETTNQHKNSLLAKWNFEYLRHFHRERQKS